MKHNLAVLGLSLWMVAGCQTQTTEPSASVPVVKPVAATSTPSPATQVTTAKPAEPTPDTRADSAAKLAAAHAAEIEVIAAHRSPGSTGVTPIEPVADAQPSQAAPNQNAKTEGGFKPIPPPPKDIAAAIAAHVSLSPADAQPSLPPPGTPLPDSASASASSNATGAVVLNQAAPMPTIAPAGAAEQPAAEAAAVDTLAGRIEKAAKEAPGDLSAQLDLQLLKFLKNDPVPSTDALNALQGEDREVLSAVLDGLSNFRNGVRKDNNLLMNRKIRPLTDMADRLRARSDLTITNPAICRSIKGWGVYEAITPLRLPAGVDNSPGLYYEIENFSPRLTADNMWETRMRQDVAIYDNRGGLVWQWMNEAVVDLCRNRRHDFFFARKVKTPIRLPQGAYILKISLTDPIAGRVAETSLALQMYVPNGPAAPQVGPPR